MNNENCCGMDCGSCDDLLNDSFIAKVGQRAPDFDLATVEDGVYKRARLADYAGKWLVLFFYPEDFTFICPTEITGYAKHMDEFAKLHAEVIGGSTDSVHAHKAWLKELGKLPFPLFADTTHVTSRVYGVLVEEKGIALRGTFIIDPEGILRYSVIHDLNVGRSVTETIRVLQGLQTGELCPVEWEAGQETLKGE